MQQGNISFPIELYNASIKGKKGNAIECLHTESPSEDAQGYCQQEDIQTEIRNWYRDACTPLQDRSETADTTHRDMIRQEENIQSNTTYQHRQGYDDVISNLMNFTFSRHKNDVYFKYGAKLQRFS